MKFLIDSRLIAILRLSRAHQEEILHGVDALYSGGVRAMEVTLGTPKALEIVKSVKKHFDKEVFFGVGSVTNLEELKGALGVGADFIVCPTLDVEVVRTCVKAGVPVLPGCYTPTEMLVATQAGAEAIKLFPAEIGGAKLVKTVLGPLPQLNIFAVGGLTLDNVEEFMRAGAVGVGVGSTLINDDVLESRRFQDIERKAGNFMRALSGRLTTRAE